MPIDKLFSVALRSDIDTKIDAKVSARSEKARTSASVFITALGLATALASAPVQAEPAGQISMTAQQIERSGIRTELALAALSAPDGKSAAGVHTALGQQGQHLSGTVVAPTNSLMLVSSAVAGVIQQIHVNSLQQVEPGTRVATLFSAPLMEMQREYLQLSIQDRLAQQKLARDESLFAEGIIAQSRVQDSRGSALQTSLATNERYQALRGAGMGASELKKILSKNALSPYLTVVAGVRGTLLELNLTAGQRIDAGMPIASIARSGALWIEFQASRAQAQEIRVGDALQMIECGSAKVIAIAPQLTGSNQSTLIRAQQANSDGCLKLNQFVEANHVGSRIAAGSVGVPLAALVRTGADAYVFVRNAQGFEAVKVDAKSGSSVAGKVWVRSAGSSLKVGSAVAFTGIVALKGAWIGLGAEAAPAVAAPAVAAPAAASGPAPATGGVK